MLKVLRAKLRQLLSLRFLVYFTLAVIVFFLFFWHISSLTPGISPAEVAARSSSRSLRLIYENPINAPHKILQHFFVKLSPSSTLALKLSTIAFAGLFGFCFYKLAASWYGKLIGFFGTMIFVSMPLFIVSARQASSQIMLFSPILLMWLYAWMTKTNRFKGLVWILLLVSAGLLMYTPGLIWFMILGAIAIRSRIKAVFSEIRRSSAVVGIVAFGVIIAPLIVSCVAHPSIVKRLLLIPPDWPSAIVVAKDTGWSVLALFIKAPVHNSLILDRLPVISVIILALLIFGGYAMQAAARAKAISLGASIVFAIVVAGVNNDVVYLALGLPAVCLLASAGLRYLYIEWRAIFPRNPVPKTFALVLIAALTITQVAFGVRYSLIAWPHSVATRSTYVLK
ncbi:glycosyltransferase family 39 protein [Candidatus Saccharibacteria bacterium]|nr:glycosyltransferase family 39 protein [Candidatus Saccharibacteria bacterium]